MVLCPVAQVPSSSSWGTCRGLRMSVLSMLGWVLQAFLEALLTTWLALQCSVMCCRSEAGARARAVVAEMLEAEVVVMVEVEIVALILLLCLGV